MTSEWMTINSSREQRLHRSPHSIYHFGVKSTHDDKDLHLVVVFGTAPGIKPGPSRRPVDGHLPARPLKLPEQKDDLSVNVCVASRDSRSTNTIVAINKDPHAPIFEFSDLAVVADMHTVVPELVELLRRHAG